ncbi:MAG: hypothetical protein JWQ19_3836 [Subtercola sp.]|nr:hypothetical protein [Subtercola sp.]
MPAETLSLEERFAALEAKVELLEDERAIREVLAKYGHFADAPDDDKYFALFTENCVMDVSTGIQPTPYDIERWEGLAEMKRFMIERTALHGNAFLGRSLHMQGNNLTVVVSGDRATATGYSFILHQDEAHVRLVSASINEWQLERAPGGERSVERGWLIQMRKRRGLGAPDTAEILAP